MQSNPKDVEDAFYGEAMSIPQAQRGTAEIPPGDLAAHILKLPFRVAFKGSRFKSQAVEILRLQPAKREPMLRSIKHWSDIQLREQIGAKIADVESALIQIVGVLPPEPCSSCLEDKGPWGKFVSFIAV